MNSEMQDRKWFWGGVALQMGTGYTIAFLVYQIGTLITNLSSGKGFDFGAGFVPGLIAVLVMVAIVVALMIRNSAKFKAEYELKKAA